MELRQNDTMAARREFASVARRLQTFFEPQNYTNVRGLSLFGYGRSSQLLHEVVGPRTGRDGASLRATCRTEGDKTFSGWRTSAAADERSGREPKQL